MLLPHVGIDSHDLWLDLVMKERRGSTCHERIAPSLSPLSHHLPHCVWLIHSCIYFLFLLPLFQRGSPYFKPVFVNPFWSADANTLYCALERIDWSWTLFIRSNKIVIRSNFVAVYGINWTPEIIVRWFGPWGQIFAPRSFGPKFKKLQFSHKTQQDGCLWTHLDPSNHVWGNLDPIAKF